jgi:predicted DNA-binding transcriptional regulator YafY
METLLFLLKHGTTGCADDLAEKLGVSRRTIYNYFEVLQDQGVRIGYDSYRKGYYIHHGDE